jgi:NADP-dependent 3-hydroxy acid dehydrogenase YdfG
MQLLKEKITWITGAGSGIGEAGALELAQAGALVVLSGRRREALEAVAAKIRATGGIAEVEPLDVGDAAAAKALGERLLERHRRVDILVNSAGINLPKRFWRDASVADITEVIHINLNGVVHCTQAVLPSMRARKDGLVINISSWAGRYISHIVGPAYNASKHAVVALTHSLNMEECANGIRACVICPGEVATPILDKRPIPPSPEERARMLQQEDLGRTIRFVAEMPAHVCVNEILISPTWNRSYLGGPDIARR